MPGIGLEEGWTDHLETGNNSDGSSFITRVLPSVLITGQTSHTNTVINYTPALVLYSSDGNQNGILQNLNAVSQNTILPDRLFIDLRAFASTQPTSSGYVPVGTVAVGRDTQTQIMGFSVHPYLRERFGDAASLEAGGIMLYSGYNELSSGGSNSSSGSNDDVVSGQEYLVVRSGPDLGRASLKLSATAAQSTGTGGIYDSNNNEVKLTLGYAITHTLTGLVAIGYDSIHYGGVPPYSQSGLEWSVGMRWDPNPDSTVIASYGREEGVDSPQIDISYAPTPRSRVYARYSEGIATGLEQLLTAMNGSTLDALGNPVAVANGAPVLIDNTFYGVQTNLAKVTSASLTGLLLQARDSFSASFGYQERVLIAGPTGAATGSFGNYAGYYGTLSWQHDLQPDLKSYLYGQWGNTTETGADVVNGSQNFDTLVFSLRLVYSLSQTMTVYAQYSWSSLSNQLLIGSTGAQPANVPSSLILIGARKTF